MDCQRACLAGYVCRRCPKAGIVLWREDAPETICHVTVAPGTVFYRNRSAAAAGASVSRRNSTRCGGRTIRGSAISPRSPDWPRRSGRERAATIGVNPLHMLFPGRRASAPVPINRLTAGSSTRSIWMFRRTLRPGFGAPESVAYSAVWAQKRAILERRFVAFPTDAPEAAAFASFRSRRWPRALAVRGVSGHRRDVARRNLDHWPLTCARPNSKAVMEFARAHAVRVHFHQYLQFLADRQFAAAAAKGGASGLELGLYCDLAVGAAPDGAEAGLDRTNSRRAPGLVHRRTVRRRGTELALAAAASATAAARRVLLRSHR